MSEAVYQRIEAVTGEDALLAKLGEAEGDWLGVHDGKFLFGYPRRGGIMEISGVEKHLHAGAAEGSHEVRIVRGSTDGTEAFTIEEEAKAAYTTAVATARDRKDVAVVRLQRIEGGKVVEETTVVRPDLRIEQVLDSTSLTLLGVILGVVLAFFFGVGTLAGLRWGLVAAVLSAVVVMAAIKWGPSKRVLVGRSRWLLNQ